MVRVLALFLNLFKGLSQKPIHGVPSVEFQDFYVIVKAIMPSTNTSMDVCEIVICFYAINILKL